jgi:FMN phosphatase YigB (HAD superfamily)
MVKAIAFDCFGVAADYSIPGSEANLASFTGVTVEDMCEFLRLAGRAEFAVGAISAESFRQRLNRLLPAPISMPALTCCWTSTYKPRVDCIHFAVSFRQFAKVPVWLWSNMNEIDRAWLKVHGVIAAFDGLVGSDEILERKPENGFYHQAVAVMERALGQHLEPFDIFLLDDSRPSVEKAQSLGMRASQYVDSRSLSAVSNAMQTDRSCHQPQGE